VEKQNRNCPPFRAGPLDLSKATNRRHFPIFHTESPARWIEYACWNSHTGNQWNLHNSSLISITPHHHKPLTTSKIKTIQHNTKQIHWCQHQQQMTLTLQHYTVYNISMYSCYCQSQLPNISTVQLPTYLRCKLQKHTQLGKIQLYKRWANPNRTASTI